MRLGLQLSVPPLCYSVSYRHPTCRHCQLGAAVDLIVTLETSGGREIRWAKNDNGNYNGMSDLFNSYEKKA